MKRIAVLTSGGDAPGMNAAIRAVVRTASANDMSVIGFKRGYNGVLMQNLNPDDDYVLMTARKVSGITRSLNTILEGIPTDCDSCGLKEICDEVEGMRELHFQQAEKNK